MAGKEDRKDSKAGGSNGANEAQAASTAAASKGGLEGVSVGKSSVSLVEGTEGRLSYRGYKIQDLAAQAPV